MFSEVELVRGVAVLAEKLDKDSPDTSKSVITTQLLKGLLKEKASKDHGYFLKVTALKKIGNGQISGDLRKMLFPVAFSCRTFIPRQGEILEGVVYQVHNLGVFIRCGPLKHGYLSARLMPNYHYAGGRNPFFYRGDLAKIEKEVVVRFRVLATRWIEKRREMRKEFVMIVSIVGDSLGPVCGPHESDF
ncbi:DNA-directed RNA polymerase subunit 7-like protein [Argentina anserina]|uniref:DNA-directed RNA polymerase subunit 7-like protein n=1 Tax=Argentina anserina TaxID=57926 RepID=UPI00217627B3|nr:DNA-directed RNA polymerase subunit 7-like protein [Potentilla anserina]XP_050385466.1 DNA-directed RNA polymerase subunit 7-like protein [Potentilla anserina]XP_050385467.1 DNA-directed RNA polymerase subunit 7-like protein [Potentilla anserina]